ncbi:MAG: hypothetical protein ACK4PK_06100 [Alphaproteobacteria bacterium]
MSQPRRNEPEKDAKPDAKSDFKLNHRDGDHSFDDDDGQPSFVVSNVKPPAPPADPNKPVTYDFIPYRSKEPRPSPGFDPDAVDDVDYRSVYGRDDDDDDFDGDEDYDPRMDDPLFRIAARILPERPEIVNTLDVISNIDVDSLIAAGIIEEEMRGHLPDKQVDRLTAASLLAGAENAYDVLGEVSKKTGELMVDFNMVSTAENPSPKEFAQYSMDIQRLVIAFNAADLEELSKGLRSQNVFAPDEETLAETAAFLVAASQNHREQPTQGDIRLMQRAARAFNEVSQILPLDIEMRLTGDSGLAVYNKNALDAHEVRKIQKNAAKKNEPKPPKH